MMCSNVCMFIVFFIFFFFKHKTAYEMRISDWSSDVCSSDLHVNELVQPRHVAGSIGSRACRAHALIHFNAAVARLGDAGLRQPKTFGVWRPTRGDRHALGLKRLLPIALPYTQSDRSEEHTSELQSPMRNSYAVICLKKKNT